MFVLLMAALPQFSALGQTSGPPQRLANLGLGEIPGLIPTYYSEGFEERAQDLQETLLGEVSFFHDAVGIEILTYLAVLNAEHWAETSGAFPYGTLYVSENPTIVFLPATSDGPVSDDFQGLQRAEVNPAWLVDAGLSFDQAAARMVDLIAFHEIGHVVHRALDVGDSNAWFREFFATFLSYCFLRREKPELAAIWNGMMQLKAVSPRPTHTTLADFEDLVFGVGLENYIWYEAQFQVRAHEVYEALGLGFISQVSTAFPKGEDSIAPHVLLEKLEEVVPGFLGWAEVFKATPGPLPRSDGG